MEIRAQIPADRFLDQAISALEAADASALDRLAGDVFSVAMPVNQAHYRRNRETFAALMEATGRNLRVLRRATKQEPAGLYVPGPRR